jgi:hypothetical protein
MQVSSTTPFRVGEWVRVLASNPGNRRNMRRSLLSLEAGLRAGAAVAANSSTAADAAARFSAATGRRLTQQAQAFSTDIPVRLFQDPYLQAAVAAPLPPCLPALTSQQACCVGQFVLAADCMCPFPDGTFQGGCCGQGLD